MNLLFWNRRNICVLAIGWRGWEFLRIGWIYSLGISFTTQILTIFYFCTVNLKPFSLSLALRDRGFLKLLEVLYDWWFFVLIKEFLEEFWGIRNSKFRRIRLILIGFNAFVNWFLVYRIFCWGLIILEIKLTTFELTILFDRGKIPFVCLVFVGQRGFDNIVDLLVFRGLN